MSRAESRELVEKLQRDTKAAGKNLVVYISMAFGNPYDEPWGAEIVEETLVWLKDLGVRTVSLADTVGTASPEEVADLYQAVKGCVAGVEIGVHLHSRPDRAAEKILAAYEAGCRRFDGALTGMGGCPFAGDELVGNIPTEAVLTTLASRGVSTGIDTRSLAVACAMTGELREKYAHATDRPTRRKRRSLTSDDARIVVDAEGAERVKVFNTDATEKDAGHRENQTMSKTPNFAAVTYDTLKCENNGTIATITLNRPEKRNAISSTMIEELLAALNSAEADAAVRVVILTGAGKAFCSGMDLETLQAICRAIC